MYFEDLALCRYHQGSLDADSWKVPLRAVGWLERPHQYPRGATPATLLSKLEVIVCAGQKQKVLHPIPGNAARILRKK